MEKGIFEKDIEQLGNPNSWQSKFGVKITKLGILPIPLILLKYRKLLKLTYSDLFLIGYIFFHKQNYNWPYISLAKITREYGISQDTLNKSVKRLRGGHFITTTPRRENPKGKGRNIYDLSGLVACLETLSEKNIDKSKWKMDDYLDFMTIKLLEKEKASENQRANNIQNGEDNKDLINI